LLLALIERHSGLVLLATNYRERLDSALERRVTHMIHLQRPQAETRLRLWEMMLPHEAPGAQEVNIKALAERHEMSGAEIRVALLRAATQAAAQDSNLTHELIESEVVKVLEGKTKKSTIGFKRIS
jgi:SpoVK/Ycf46/Vps4 family AAA+-type ATPase